MSSVFRHVETGRAIVFGRGAVEQAGDLIPERFTLPTTPRAAASVPELAERADAVVHVPAGAVDVLAGELRPAVTRRPLVALGGGRVVDVAKAIAAAEGITTVVAVPTSLSGAEMTGAHRQARGARDDRQVRPSIVVNDPQLSASLPAPELAATSANALAHAANAVVSVRSSPIAAAVARDAIARMAAGWSDPEDPDRDAVALAALLSGWAADLSGLGPHHALAQTAVRLAELPHARTNAALLPLTVRAYETRAGEIAGAGALADLLKDRAGAHGLPGLAGELLERAVQTASGRPELDRVPPALTADEVRELYLAA